MQKLFAVLFVLAVTLFAVPSFAQDQPVTQSSWGAVKERYRGSGADTQKAFLTPQTAANALKAGHVSEGMMAVITEQSAEFQMEVAKHLWIADGMDPNAAIRQVNDLRQELGLNRQARPSFASSGSCDQYVEYKTVVRDPVWAYMTTSFSSSRGTEYYYYFNPWWTVSADNIRWAASDPRVHWAVWVRTWSSGIAGYGLCGKPFRLMLGNGVVSLAGGQYGVMANLYVHHQ